MTTTPSLLNTNLDLLPQSFTCEDGLELALARTAAGLRLAVLGPLHRLTGFSGQAGEAAAEQSLLIGNLDSHNLDTLRKLLPWLNPRPLGLRTSAGMGDRIGLATPGHIRAVRATGEQIAPIFTQQSIREMKRTNRNARQVMEDALWGVFTEGWQGGFGADADHLKTPADIDTCLEAGYTFFTIDPGEYVNNAAERANLAELHTLCAALPEEMAPAASGLLGKTLTFEDLRVEFSEIVLFKAAVKYGAAVWHVARMYQHLTQSAAGQPVELEVSVDETELPTSHAEHAYIASELTRLGVRWVSLAPRYIGRFEKGVDYIGDLTAFEQDIAGHAAIARQMGPYKLSLHSGSDKFSIYPSAAFHTRGLAHLKTAGTSYLEALRAVAAQDVALFREIYAFARQRFETDKASYHLSARLERAPEVTEVKDWLALLDQFDARQILHVTFGSVLTNPGYYDALIACLKANPEAYAANLERHFIRHLQPFCRKD